MAEAGANIDEVHHQRAFTMLAAQNVEIELVLQTRGREHMAAVLAALHAAGFAGAGAEMNDRAARSTPCRDCQGKIR